MKTSKYILREGEEESVMMAVQQALDKNNIFIAQLETEVRRIFEQSNKPWGSVDKTKLPASCFLWVIDPEKKPTWKLPYREGAGGIDPETGMYKAAGEVNVGALRAIASAIAGARTGMVMSVPPAVRSKIKRLLKQHKIGSQMESYGTISKQREFKELLGGDQFKETKLDKEKNRILGVAILRETSENCSFEKGTGRMYSKKARESTAHLVEGKKAYIDHASAKSLEQNRGVRSVKDLFGYYENGRLDNGTVRADLVYLKNHAVWIEPLVEQMSDKIGESVHAFGPSVFNKESAKEIVEDVTVLASVDLVTEPGSTLNLFESGVAAENTNEEVEIVELESLTLEELKESRGDLVQSLTDDITAKVKADITDADNTKALQENVSELKTENKGLKEKLDVFEVKDAVAQRETKILELISESKIDKKLVSDTFMQNLREAKDDEMVKKLIEDRKELVSATTKKGVKGMGDESDAGDKDGKAESKNKTSESSEGMELLEAIKGVDI